MFNYERLEEAMNLRASSPSKLTEALKLSSGQFSIWKKGTSKPSTEAIEKLANVLNVSTDYLLGRTDDPSPYPNQNLNIPQDIANVQFAFYEGDKDELTQEDIDDIAKYVRYMREKRRKENESKK